MKSKIFIGIFLILILIANVSFASYSTVTMSVVEEPVCTIQMEEHSKFEKKLISKDLQNKEVTLQLSVTNEEEADKPTGEVVLVIDNSHSMNDPVDSTHTRGEVIKSSSKTLVNNLLKDNTKLKIGAVSFSTKTPEDGVPLVVGTEDDSALLTNLTNDVSTLQTAIDNIVFPPNGVASFTDLQAGLRRGKQLFSSENTNKYLIVLTDGIPNVILGRNEVVYNDETISATKTEYQSIASSGINVITMLSGIANGDSTIPETSKTFNQYIESLFGTSTNPTAGKFYYIQDNKIEETITQNIYNDLMPVSKTLKNITVVDYFPQEIIDNFDFAYVKEKNMGTISAEIDKTNNSITWTIPELASGETALVQYKLKLKENFNSAIVDKIINTNQKVDLKYTDFDGKEQTKTSDVTPKLKLTEPPAVLPKAGTITLISFAVLSFGLFGYSMIKLISVHKKMN